MLQKTRGNDRNCLRVALRSLANDEAVLAKLAQGSLDGAEREPGLLCYDGGSQNVGLLLASPCSPDQSHHDHVCGGRQDGHPGFYISQRYGAVR